MGACRLFRADRGRRHVFPELAFVAAAHHERLDGRGYPRGLAADRIPFETRIITVADIFDAIRGRAALPRPDPVADAIAMMEKERGTAIDGACLEALKQALPQLGF